MCILFQSPFIHINVFLSSFLHCGKTLQDLKSDRCLIKGKPVLCKEVEDNGISKFLNVRGKRDFYETQVISNTSSTAY